MKIATIASSPQVLEGIREILEGQPDQDHFVFFQRQNGDIFLNQIDLFSTNILILDAERVSSQDIQTIKSCTRDNPNPAIILATGNRDEAHLTELMRAGVSEVIGFPIIEEELHGAINRLRSRRYISTNYHPRGKIISFLSPKGGAGATFIAGNLGYILAASEGKKVLFIDLHMQFGDASFYLTEAEGATSIADIIGQVGLDSSVIASATIQIDKNFNLLQAPDSPDKAAGVKPQHIDNLLTVAIQDFDYVIVDLTRTIDALSMMVLDRSDQIYLVLQPIIPYIRATAKVLTIYDSLGYESNKIKTVLNRTDTGSSISVKKIEDALQRKIDYLVPNDYANCMQSVNAGIPVFKLNERCQLSHALIDMSKDMVGDGEKNDYQIKKSFLGKLFK